MSVTSTDPIADMLTRIRNAINVRKHDRTPATQQGKAIRCRTLKQSNFLDDVKVEGDGIAKELVITINGEHSNARITEIARMSKPGRRYYVAVRTSQPSSAAVVSSSSVPARV